MKLLLDANIFLNVIFAEKQFLETSQKAFEADRGKRI